MSAIGSSATNKKGNVYHLERLKVTALINELSVLPLSVKTMARDTWSSDGRQYIAFLTVLQKCYEFKIFLFDQSMP